MSKPEDKDPAALLAELLQGGGVGRQPTPEEMKAEFAKQAKEISDNFRKLETDDIIRMLVAAENFLAHIERSQPSLTMKNHAMLKNAKTLIGCVLDGKKPDNFNELGPKF